METALPQAHTPKTKETSPTEFDDSVTLSALERSIDSSNNKVDDSDFEPPDGGFDAWLTVLGTTLVSFSTFG